MFGRNHTGAFARVTRHGEGKRPTEVYWQRPLVTHVARKAEAGEGPSEGDRRVDSAKPWPLPVM